MIRTSARIVAATARNLAEEVQKRAFRDDLYYRLNVIPIHLPPLRERPDDIPLLARYFLDSLRRSMHVSVGEFETSVLDAMKGYAWPGNVRELRNVVERVLVLHGGEKLIRVEHLPDAMRVMPPPLSHTRRTASVKLAEAVAAFERSLVEDALREAGGIQTRAARLLGTTRRILNYRMRKLNIE